MKDEINEVTNLLLNIAPRIVEYSLNQGAENLEIELLEQTIQKKLPEDFKDFYKLINGNNQDENFGNFFCGLSLNSIREIIGDWKFRKKFSEEIDLIKLNKQSEEIDNSNFYNLNWIPFASDGSRDGLFLDLAPTKVGTIGQIIYLEGTELIGLLVAKSTLELIQIFKNDLKSNNYYLASDALEDGHHWLETKDNICLVRKAFQIKK